MSLKYIIKYVLVLPGKNTIYIPTGWLMIMALMLFTTTIFAKNKLKQLTNIDGLTNNAINSLFEDSEQNLWIGTWDGLSSYNGRDFTNYRYNKKDGNSISNNIVRNILETDSFSIWVATDFGINCINTSTKEVKRYYPGGENNPPKQEHSYLLSTTAGNDILCYVKQKGLFYLNKQTGYFNLIDSLASYDVKKMVISKENKLHLLDENGTMLCFGLNISINGSVHLLPYQTAYTTNGIADIFYSNGLLITNYGTYIKITDKNNKYPSSIDIDPNKKISQIINHRQTLYISYYHGGIDLFDMESKTFHAFEEIPKDPAIFTMYYGSQDVLWIGTDGQGLFQVFQHQSPFNTVITNFPVRTFCHYDDNKIIIGTKGGGIKLFDSEKEVLENLYTTQNGLIDNSVYTIIQNKRGDNFIGTEGAGINVVMDGKRLSTLQMPTHAPEFKAVYCAEFTNNDSILWLGTSGYGLIKINCHLKNNRYIASEVKQFQASQAINSLNNDIIYAIVKDKDSNKLWIGTRGGGLYLFDTATEVFEKFEDPDKQQILSSNDILSIVRDTNALWVGTSYGLNRIDFKNGTPNGIREYTVLNGLLNNTVHGILTNKQSLWISTNQGLSKINLEQDTIVNYSVRNGLQNDEFSDGAYYKDENNTLYFGGVSGFNYFDPNSIFLRQFSPEIALSNLKVYNTSVNFRDRIKNNKLKLAYDEAYVTFTFVAKDFINNENCEYKYRLINFSDEWINNGTNPNIVFTKLPPGEYILEVQATNGDRIWGKYTYSLIIDIAPPWWVSPIAIIVYGILLLLLAYVIYSVIKNRIRLNRELLLEHIEKKNQQKIHESKLNFFTHVAHEFFTPLTLIYGPAQYLLEKDKLSVETKRYVQIIKNNADRMQKLINELMEFRKTESGHTPLHPEEIDIRLLVNYITDNYSEIATQNKIDLSVTFQEVANFRTDKNSIEKILFNVISNAFKYTPLFGYIKLNVSQKDDEIHISIINSGKGLTEYQMVKIFNQFKIFESPKLKNSHSTGIGLVLTKSLIELLGGTIRVSSKLDNYVRFDINIPAMLANDEPEQGEQNKSEPDTISRIYTNKNILILIVDDEKDIRNLLADILSPYYEVIETENGEEAYNILKINMPNIIISDIMMPKMDGISFIEKVKADPIYAHIPIITISARIAMEDHINAFEHGAELYITKPFHPRHILATVQNVINRYSILKDYFNSGMSSITIKDGQNIHQKDDIFIQELIAYIEKNIDDEQLSAATLAEALGLSKATLYRKLKDINNRTPSEFIRNIRLNRAAKLLISSKMTVQQIMFKTGFTNKSYFYREFAKIYHSTPMEYREKQWEE